MSAMKPIYTEEAATPMGHYVQAMQANGMIYVSGILGVKAKDLEIIVRPLDQQVQTCLDNLKAILKAADASLNDVVKVTIYLDDVAKWDVVNEIYTKEFGDHKPARAIVPTRGLHHGFEVEIEAIALAPTVK